LLFQRTKDTSAQRWLGKFNYVCGLIAPRIGFIPLTKASVPIPFLLAVVLPFAAASCTRFRFPLWSYFAWTALLAAELAYYLR
jgi:hypothetical protein